MNVKSIRVIMVFLAILICLLSTVSATEDVAIDTTTDAINHVST
ncbi:hypothetical protein [uncultured Methanobrevibacter sp.]|nr:hypothetical protein [uncultured Methanobrevibacter sp.]